MAPQKSPKSQVSLRCIDFFRRSSLFAQTETAPCDTACVTASPAPRGAQSVLRLGLFFFYERMQTLFKERPHPLFDTQKDTRFLSYPAFQCNAGSPYSNKGLII